MPAVLRYCLGCSMCARSACLGMAAVYQLVQRRTAAASVGDTSLDPKQGPLALAPITRPTTYLLTNCVTAEQVTPENPMSVHELGFDSVWVHSGYFDIIQQHRALGRGHHGGGARSPRPAGGCTPEWCESINRT